MVWQRRRTDREHAGRRIDRWKAPRRDIFAVVLISFVSQPHGKNSSEKSEKNNDFFVDSKTAVSADSYSRGKEEKSGQRTEIKTTCLLAAVPRLQSEMN